MRANVEVIRDDRQVGPVFVLDAIRTFTKAAQGASGVVVLPPTLTNKLEPPLRRMLDRLAISFTPENGGPGLGNWNADTLLVGDRPSGRVAVNWPFISVMMTGCAAWLAGQLEDASIPESSLYWINAYDAVGNPTQIDLTRFKNVYALGLSASRWCRAQNVPFIQVHHPQYWKRTYPDKTYRLIKLLSRHFRSGSGE